jgi:hypothetical protein
MWLKGVSQVFQFIRLCVVGRNTNFSVTQLAYNAPLHIDSSSSFGYTVSFGYILHCVCFNLYCGDFILFCNVCVYVWVL